MNDHLRGHNEHDGSHYITPCKLEVMLEELSFQNIMCRLTEAIHIYEMA